MKEKVLITGGSGLLAVNWAISINNNYDVTSLLHHRKISLLGVNTAFESIDSLDKCFYVLDKYRPDIVIHTAGLTNIEECESDPNLAYELNVNLAKNLAIACNQLSVKLINISTDHLFLGAQKFSTEDSITKAANTYAKTKLLGESEVLKYSKNAMIIRTNFFGWGPKYRQSFSDIILKKLRNNEKIGLFSDVFFNPILIDELAKRTHQLIDLNASGIFNIVSSERISKFEFGIKLANCFNLNSDLINEIKLKDIPNLVKRPKEMSLSNKKICRRIGFKMPSIDEQFQVLKKQESDCIIS